MKTESKKNGLLRRLEEYIEYAEAAKKFADVGFYLELTDYIEDPSKFEQTKGVNYCSDHGGYGFSSDCIECNK